MAPKKKAQKISLNEFLGDGSGSWADEMESLPNAPARTDEERANDRYGRKDDFLSSRPDRGSGPPREDLPLPTQPPYTAFIGNLAFDIAEQELEQFFGACKTIKIIKDREDKPKGFGYIEFTDLEGLKDALAKSGSSLSGRTVRVSVAEPPKERGGLGGFEDEAKFDNPWRRDGPLPDREQPRRRFDGPSGDKPAGVSESVDQWRSSRPPRSDPEPPSFKRKGSGFGLGETSGAADKEDTWTIGAKFKAATPDESSGPKFGRGRGEGLGESAGMADKEETWTIGAKFKATAAEETAAPKYGRARGEGGPTREGNSPAVVDEIDWRSASRPKPVARDSTSPSSSTPPTPQLGRRKLELLPRSGGPSVVPTPLSSPKMAATTSASSISRASPFGAARPVDVTSREKEVAERLEKEREIIKDRPHPMSRTSSRTASDRNVAAHKTPPPSSAPTSPGATSTPASPRAQPSAVSATVRPSFSFASAASGRKNTTERVEIVRKDTDTQDGPAKELTDKVAAVGIAA